MSHGRLWIEMSHTHSHTHTTHLHTHTQDIVYDSSQVLGHVRGVTQLYRRVFELHSCV